MSSWTLPVRGEPGNHLRVSELDPFTREDWFPSDGVKIMSEKGSMTMQTLPCFMRHFNNFARKHVPADKKILLTLDGHSSRKGISWLDEAVKCNAEVAKAPANTCQFLQPCDQDVNNVINSRVRRIRDRLLAAGLKNSKSVKFKLICGLAAMDDLSLNDIRLSFSRIGLWPMDMRFVNRMKSKMDMIKDEAEKQGEAIRVPDSTTAKDCRSILENNMLQPEQQLKQLSILLKNCETVNNVLMTMKQPAQQHAENMCREDQRQHQSSPSSCYTRHTTETNCSVNVAAKNHHLGQGLLDMSPARHLTHGESMVKLREKLAEEEKLEKEKQRRKEERTRKRAEADACKTKVPRKRVRLGTQKRKYCNRSTKMLVGDGEEALGDVIPKEGDRKATE